MKAEIDKIVGKYTKPFTDEDKKIMDEGFSVSETDENFTESNNSSLSTPIVKDPPKSTKIFANKVITMERQIAKLRQQNVSLQEQLESKNMKEQEEYKIDDDKFKIPKMEDPSVKDQIISIKCSLESVIVSEEEYLHIQSMPEDKRTLRDFVAMKIYNDIQIYRKKMEGTRKEAEQMREEMMQNKEKLKIITTEKDHLQKMYEQKELQDKRFEDGQQAKIKDLEMLLDKEQKRCLENNDKVRSYNENSIKLNDMEKTINELRTQLKQNEDRMATITNEGRELSKVLDNYKQENKILINDKAYLTKETESLADRYKRADEKLESVQKDLETSKTKANEYLDRLLNSQQTISNVKDAKYEKELEEIKERHKKELELAKSNISEVHEKRIEYLKEAKEDAETKLTTANKQLQDKTAAYDELLLEYRVAQKKVDQELSELRLQNRFKTDEVMRITSQYEDNMSVVKELKTENAMIKDKLDVMRSEFYQLETKCKQEQSDLRAQNAMFKERLTSYETIEKDLDQAIDQVAENESSDVLNAIKGAPTNAKRRVQQSLILATKLQQKQKENDQLREALAKADTMLMNCKDELEMNKKVVEKTTQPHSYMVASIEKSEVEMFAVRKTLKQYEQQIDNLKQENKKLREQKESVECDLNKVLTMKENIDELKSTFYNALKNGNTKVDVNKLKDTLNNRESAPRSRSRSAKKLAFTDKKQENNEPNVPTWYKTLASRLVGKAKPN